MVGEDDPPELPCRAKAKALHEAYSAWCDEAGGAHWRASGFKAAMIDKGFAQKTSNGVWWIGLQPVVALDDVKQGYWTAADEVGGDGFASSSAAVGNRETPLGHDLPEGFD